ncbi:MAG: PEP-CTERM sorting domain-containing protein [Planctomycetota bacterium]
MKLSKTRRISLVIATAGLVTSAANAALVLTIDPTANTLTFTGTDTVTLDPEFPFFGPPTGAFEGTPSWTIDENLGVFTTIGPDAGIQTGFVGFNGTNFTSTARTLFLVYENGGLAFVTTVFDTNSALAEFGGSGVAVSYDGLLDAESEAYLESLDGRLFETGFSDTAVGHSDMLIRVVPEPASLALLSLGGLALFRRRCRT